ncbi:MAG: cytochrome b/b6 domain-containing protein, partial [Pseudomonadota bacterium]
MAAQSLRKGNPMPVITRSILLIAGLFCMNAAAASDAINLAAGGSGTSTRLDGDLESWVAIGIVLSSLLTAWCMNAAAPKVRSLGTLLGAAGCFAVALWFFGFVLGTGFLENPKPNQTPLDSAKPALLWMQGGVALFAGLFLLRVGLKQFAEQQPLDLPRQNESHRYGGVSRLLHWTTAILFIALIPMGIFASIIPEGTAYRNAYYVVHKTIGVLVFMLLIARLVWHTRSKRPSLDTGLTTFERKAAHTAHLTLYGFLIALPIT